MSGHIYLSWGKNYKRYESLPYQLLALGIMTLGWVLFMLGVHLSHLSWS